MSTCTTVPSKTDAYHELVARRQACRLCQSLTNVSEVAGGSLDSEEVGPYTRWHADLDARLMVVAKDFAPATRLAELEGRPGASVPTNARLKHYLSVAGFECGSPRTTYRDRGLFFTNAVLCLPEGESMRTTVRAREVKECASGFLRPTIELIRPRAIATLGSQAASAVLEAMGVAPRPSFGELVDADAGLELPGGVVLLAMPHPMGTSRTKIENEAAWARVRRLFAG